MIEISKNYRLKFDHHNVIVVKRFDIKAGMAFGKEVKAREEWREVAYYSTIKGAFNYFSEQTMREAKSLKELQEKIEMLHDTLNHLFNRCKVSVFLS